MATKIEQALAIPTIGIGAGGATTAQVLVLHDMLGLNPQPAKFVRNFMADADSIQQALSLYHQAVINGKFPESKHIFE